MTATVPPTLPAADRAGAAAPPEWQARLVALLGRLEHFWADVAGRRAAGDAAFLLGRAAAALRAADELAQDAAFGAESLASLEAATARAGAFTSAAQEVRRAARGGVLGVWASLTGHGADPRVGSAVRGCLRTAAEAMRHYFAAFARQLPTAAAAAAWGEAADGFLADYQDRVNALPD